MNLATLSGAATLSHFFFCFASFLRAPARTFYHSHSQQLLIPSLFSAHNCHAWPILTALHSLSISLPHFFPPSTVTALYPLLTQSSSAAADTIVPFFLTCMARDI